MRLFLTTWGYPSKNAKGNPFVKEIAEAMARRGVEVFVVVVSFRGLRSLFSASINTEWQNSDLVQLREVTIMNWIPGFLGLRQLGRRMAQKQMTRALISLVKDVGEPDAFQIHYVLHSSGWLFTEFLNNVCKKYVLFEHSPGASFMRGIKMNYGGFDNMEELNAYVRGASLRIARIDKYADKLEAIYGVPFERLPSFISKQTMESVDVPKTDAHDEKFSFISIGSLIPRKGFDLLIDAFHHGFYSEPNVTLTIVGGGDLEAELRKQIEQHGMSDQIILTGEISKSHVFELIQASDVVVLASEWETFGNTVIEGMLHGKPVVSTRCDGPETIITDETGVLCDRDMSNLAAAMNDVYKNYNRFDSQKIMEYCRDNYSENAVMDKLSHLYTKSLGLDF
ncbi:MAG: hypothetical protein Salg2KO_19980 [Salibacteraceae bacterium]